MEYVPYVNRFRDVAREYWFELLIGALAISAMCELVIASGRDTSLWFDMPLVALAIAPLFARRRFPFAAPAAYWIMATAISFIDGALIPSMTSLFPIGLAAAFLLGNQRDSGLAWTGLAIVLGGITTVVYNIPGHANAELLFVPVDFGIAWAAGFALRARSEQAEAAETRAMQAEREREAAARVAVAEERTRIARELHDIVAHAVSVMVLQVGAVRHSLPDELAEDADALQGVERAGRTALTEMRRLLGAMHDGEDADMVSDTPLREATRRNTELWAACIAGAIPSTAYLGELEAAGFAITATRPNDYRFLTERARDACRTYGVESLSIAATREAAP